MGRLLWLLALLALFPIAGWVYQYVGARKDRRRYISRGRMLKLADGREVYLAEMGPSGTGETARAGAVTVVFESGVAATSQNWLQVQEQVAQYARTVSYDRAGLGWSSASATARTPGNIARELRETLRAAGIEGPFVIVGHSFGGLIARRFAAEYADEVVGVVLVDPMRPEEWPPLNESARPSVDRGARLAGYGVIAARLGLARLGITSLLCRSGRASRMFSRAAGEGGAHVMGRITCEIGKMPREVWPVVAAHWSAPKYYRGLQAHVHAVPATVMEMQDAPPLDVPVVLLTPGDTEPLCEERLRRIGTEVRQVIAEKSGHWVHLDEPELVLAAIREMVTATAPLPMAISN